MAIGRYYKYKCKKCGYTFTKYQSDVFMPVSCPKCGGEVEKLLLVFCSDIFLSNFGELLLVLLDDEHNL